MGLFSSENFALKNGLDLPMKTFTASIFYVNIFKCSLQRNMKQIKHNNLRLLTGRRQTSWLFTKRGGVEFRTTEIQLVHGRQEDLNAGPPDYKSSVLTTRPRRLL